MKNTKRPPYIGEIIISDIDFGKNAWRVMDGIHMLHSDVPGEVYIEKNQKKKHTNKQTNKQTNRQTKQTQNKHKTNNQTNNQTNQNKTNQLNITQIKKQKNKQKIVALYRKSKL